MEIKTRIQILELLDNPFTSIVAELGCAEGNFSRDLLTAGVGQLVMVDNWGTIQGVTGDGSFNQGWHEKNYYDAMEKVSSHGDNVKVLRGLTTEMASQVQDNSIDLLYLDAGHSYEAVMADLKAWYPKVKDMGIIAGHDYLNPAYGVNKAVEEFVNNYTEIHTIPEEKDEDAGFWFVKFGSMGK